MTPAHGGTKWQVSARAAANKANAVAGEQHGVRRATAARVQRSAQRYARCSKRCRHMVVAVSTRGQQ